MDKLLSPYFLFINQIHEPLEVSDAEAMADNHYLIMDERGRSLYRAVEISSACCRTYRGEDRALALHFYDMDQNVVLKTERRCRCVCMSVPWQLDRVRVFDSAGKLLGKVVERFNALTLWYDLLTDNDNLQMVVRGTRGTRFRWLCPDGKFLLMSPDEERINGEICRCTSSEMRNLFSTTDMVGVLFSRYLTLTERILIVVVTLLTDCKYFRTGKLK